MAEVTLEEGAWITLFDTEEEREEWTFLVQRITKNERDGTTNVELARKYQAPMVLHIRKRKP